MNARAAVAGVAAVLLLAGIAFAGLRGLADTEYYPARRAMAQWAAERRAPRESEWQAARAAVERAAALAPGNPLYVEELGRLLEMRAAQLDRAGPEARNLLEGARAQFRRAAELRPGSPYAWASLALVKFRLNELDFEFYGALDRAARFGPWEPAVQLTLADIGLGSWPWLAYPGRQIVLGAIERGLRRQKPELARIAAAHTTSPAFCADPLTRARPARELCSAG